MLRRLLLTVGLASLAGACGGGGGDPTPEIVVFAASSLTDAFTELGEAFVTQHPGAQVTFNFAGSGELVAQLLQGAPADVFVAADESQMAKLVAADENQDAPIVIARNTFQIIVEAGNPVGVVGLADLADPGLIVVLCADSVPCGQGAAAVLARAGVSVSARSLEDSVKGVVTKVAAGETDAGIVFVTDVIAAGNTAEGVGIPAELNVITSYPIVLTRAAANAATARQFVDFVAGAQGQAILSSYGFLAP